MPHKTLYIAPSEEALWAAAQRVAEKANTSVSRLVAEALRREIPRVDAELSARPAVEWDRIATEAA